MESPQVGGASNRGTNWKKEVKEDDLLLFTDASPHDLIIVIMGLTGAGKSTFINRVCAKENEEEIEIMKVGHRLAPCTQRIDYTTIVLPQNHQLWPNRRLVLVDTPGFDDTSGEYETLRKISVWLASVYDKDMKITGLVYLHNIGQNRIGGSALLSYDVFHRICGLTALDRVVMATTQWDTIAKPSIGKIREDELQTEWWEEVLTHGAHYERIQGVREKDIVEYLLKNHSVSTQIQEELVDKNKQIMETEAGRKLIDRLKKTLLGNPEAQQLNPEIEEELKAQFPADSSFLDRVKSLFRPRKSRSSPRDTPSRTHNLA